MTKPKPLARTQEAATVIDKLVAEIDPQVLLAGALGAVAVKGGMIPPFTRLLMAMGSFDGDMTLLSSDYAENKDKYLNAFSAMSWYGGLVPGILGTIFFQSEKAQPDGTTASATAAESMRGAMAAGMLEAMMMMAFMQNPGAMDLVGKLADKLGGGAAMLAKAL